MPEVSVCVVNWNCRALLRACLRSLAIDRQQVDAEVLVVDNGSSDGAADLVAAEFPDVVLIRNADNVGFGRANNQAARLARGRRLLFLNNDTEMPGGSLRALLDFADAHPEASAIGPRLLGSDGQPQVSFRCRPTVAALLHRTILFRWTGLFRSAYRRYRGRNDDFVTTRPADALLGAALLVDRARFEAIGGWDEGFVFGGEDLDLCARLTRSGPVIYYPGVSVLHHGRASSRLHADYVHTHTAAGMMRYLRLHVGSPAAVCFYKTAVTVDAPLQWLVYSARRLLRQLRGRTEGARKCQLLGQVTRRFVGGGLVHDWKA